MLRIVVLLCGVICFLSTTTLKAGGINPPKVGFTDARNILIIRTELKGNDAAIGKLEAVLSTLNKKQNQYKSETDFVEYLYYFTHRKLLKKYEQYASLSETLTVGSYDCLTATAIYSILFTELSIPHAVVETNYHIYILVYPDTKAEILIETTDPAYGFVNNANEIEVIKSKHRASNDEFELGQADLDLNIERRLSGTELIGLLYFNQSVRELNLDNWQNAENLAYQSRSFYSNNRVNQLVKLIDSSKELAAL